MQSLLKIILLILYLEVDNYQSKILLLKEIPPIVCVWFFMNPFISLLLLKVPKVGPVVL